MFEITLINGDVRQVRINRFKALEGWNIQREYFDFAASTDNEYRRKFVMGILAHAMIISGEREMPLLTDALIDNHLQTWQNVHAVFEAVLMENGINPQTHATNPAYWEEVGSKMAVSFLAEVSKLMGPAFKLAKVDGE